MYKYIRTHSFCDNAPSNRYGNAFIIPNNYDHSLKAFLKLFDEIRKDFPELKVEDCVCTTVINSRWCKNMPVLRFPCPPDIIKDGWHSVACLPDIITAN